MIDYLQAHQADVWHLFLQHVALCSSALGLALLIALPLGVIIARYTTLYTPVMGLLGSLYTIPSLALFALLVPITHIGTTPALIALVIYAQFILVRNVVAGLRAVEPATVEAARGMGMSSWQLLWRVEMPLALPVMAAGLRIATVTVIAVASVATYVAAGGLGDLLSEGVNKGPVGEGEIEAGAVAIAALAILADIILRLLETLAARWSGRAALAR
jgi:osmoprotectant transport system permease protein